MGEDVIKASKNTFKLFDFFAVCEYFEEKYNYDQVLKLPNPKQVAKDNSPEIDIKPKRGEFDNNEDDYLANIQETYIGTEGMKVDRMFFQQFEDKVKQDTDIVKAIEAGNIDTAMGLTLDKYLNKPQEFFTVDKLRKALKLDRKVTLREILEQIFYGNTIKGKEELMTDEFEKFISTVPENEITDVEALKYYFYAYLTDPNLRKIIDTHDYTELNYNPTFGVDEFTRVDEKMREKIPYYIKTYIPLDKFLSA
jgi:type I restriction enzyme R subunit